MRNFEACYAQFEKVEQHSIQNNIQGDILQLYGIARLEASLSFETALIGEAKYEPASIQYSSRMYKGNSLTDAKHQHQVITLRQLYHHTLLGSPPPALQILLQSRSASHHRL